MPAGLAGDDRNPTPGAVVALQLPGVHLPKVKRNLSYEAGLGLDVYRPARASGRRTLAFLREHPAP